LWVRQLHENGYTYTGDTSFYKLTVREVRVLLEGMAAEADRKARESGTTQGSGPHERRPGQPRTSDTEWVQQLAQST
jgi:hypothetical protein